MKNYKTFITFCVKLLWLCFFVKTSQSIMCELCSGHKKEKSYSMDLNLIELELSKDHNFNYFISYKQGIKYYHILTV